MWRFFCVCYQLCYCKHVSDDMIISNAKTIIVALQSDCWDWALSPLRQIECYVRHLHPIRFHWNNKLLNLRLRLRLDRFGRLHTHRQNFHPLKQKKTNNNTNQMLIHCHRSVRLTLPWLFDGLIYVDNHLNVLDFVFLFSLARWNANVIK